MRQAPVSDPRAGPPWMRLVVGGAVGAVAALLTAFATVLAYQVSNDTCAACTDLGWFFVTVVAVTAVVGWLIAIVALRTHRRVVWIVAVAYLVGVAVGGTVLFLA